MPNKEIITLKNIISDSIESDEKRIEAIKKLGRLANKNEEAFNMLIELTNEPILAKDKNEIISILIPLIGNKLLKHKNIKKKKIKNEKNQCHF